MASDCCTKPAVGPDRLCPGPADEKPKSAIAPVQRDMPMANNAIEPTPYTPERLRPAPAQGACRAEYP
jgi:hypothetical protein